MTSSSYAYTRESNAPAELDIGVVIERVRVVTGTSCALAMSEPSSSALQPPSSRAFDCRIHVGELIIETPGTLDVATAYQLGSDVAQTLADALSSLQEERLQSQRVSAHSLGPLTIRTVHARLLGQGTPSAQSICQELVAAIEGRLLQ